MITQRVMNGKRYAGGRLAVDATGIEPTFRIPTVRDPCGSMEPTRLSANHCARLPGGRGGGATELWKMWLACSASEVDSGGDRRRGEQYESYRTGGWQPAVGSGCAAHQAGAEMDALFLVRSPDSEQHEHR